MLDRLGRWEHALPFVSALLFWAAFPPLNLWPVMWIAPIPLLVYILARPLTWRRAAVIYAAGWAGWAANVYWFWHVAPLGIFLGPIYRAAMWPAFAALLRWIRGPAWLVAPSLWALQEYAALVFPLLGFPFKLIGYSQIELSSYAQIADLGGVHLVGFPIVMFAAVCAQSAVSGFPRAGAVATVAVVLLSVGYGAVRLSTLEIRDGPNLLIVQPNIPQDVKEIVAQMKESPQARRKRMAEVYDKHLRLTREGFERASSRIDLAIWPEATIPGFVVANSGKLLDEESYPWLVGPPREWKTAFVIGCSIYELEGRRIYNSACIVDGRGEVQGRYDKVELVAFGEYVPDLFKWFVEKYTRGLVPNCTPGPDFVVWEGPGAALGPEICFEGLVPHISRRLAGKGARAIVNISNDGWFKASGELDETLAIARLRSIENRVGFVRATNTGISAIIDPAGRVRARIEGKEVEGWLEGRLPLCAAGSFYRAAGDVFLLACGLLAAGLAVAGRFR